MRCQGCGVEAPTKFVTYYQNIGMLIIRSMRTFRAQVCRDCASRHFWNMTLLGLVTGWWGLISLIINPFLIINNVVQFVGTRGLPGPDVAPPLDRRA
jgi:hypothetical protein